MEHCNCLFSLGSLNTISYNVIDSCRKRFLDIKRLHVKKINLYFETSTNKVIWSLREWYNEQMTDMKLENNIFERVYVYGMDQIY